MTIAFVGLIVFLGILLYCAIWVAHYWLYNFIYYKCKPISKKIEFSYWYEHSRAKEFFGVISIIWWLVDVIAPFGFIIAGVVIGCDKLFRKILKVA